MLDLSIIVTVFQAEKYVRACLLSLLFQNIENYEIICIDDGSCDKSAILIRELQTRYPVIHYVYQPNGGVSSARNHGLKLAQGKYVMFVDADDILRENKLGLLLKKAEERDCDILVFGGQADLGIRAPEWVREAFYTRNGFFTDITQDVLLHERGLLPSVCNKIFRRGLLQDHWFQTSIIIGEDTAFLFEIALKARNICLVSKHIYIYRISNSCSAMHHYNQRYNEKMDQHLKVIEYILSLKSDDGHLVYHNKKIGVWCSEYMKGIYDKLSEEEQMQICLRLEYISLSTATDIKELLRTEQVYSKSRALRYGKALVRSVRRFGFFYGMENVISKFLQLEE